MASEWSRVLCCVCIALTCVLASRRVAASDALRVLVRVASPADRALVARVRGQLSDVNAALTPVETAALEATFAEQVQAAHALAEQHQANVVLWFASTPAPQPTRAPGLLVHVATPGDERILTRRLFDVDAADGGKVPSSLLETAALAVRSAVTALAAGGGIGVSTAQALAAEASATPTPSLVELSAESASARGLVASPPPAATSIAGTTMPPPSAATLATASTHGVTAPAPAAANPAIASERGAASSRPTATPMRASADARTGEAGSEPAGAVAELPSPSEPHAQGARQRIAAFPIPQPSASNPIDTSAEPDTVHDPHEPTALNARLQLGVQCVIDGQSDLGQRGLYARAGVGWGAFALDAYAVASLASTIDDAYFALRVARHALGGALSAHTPLSRDAQLAFGVHSGAVLLSRTSSARDTGVASAPSSLMAAFAFGPELGLDWLFGRYGLGVQLALDVLPNAPRFETSGASPLDSHRLWMLQPRLGIGLEAAVP